jgi:hypothetical protein
MPPRADAAKDKFPTPRGLTNALYWDNVGWDKDSSFAARASQSATDPSANPNTAHELLTMALERILLDSDVMDRRITAVSMSIQ